MLISFVIAVSSFTSAAGVWLLAMENILLHQGHGQRSMVALCIACQGIATLFWSIRNAAVLGRVVLVGNVAILCVGASAFWNATTAGHFEGFAVIIAAALVAQSLVTFAVLYRRSTI